MPPPPEAPTFEDVPLVQLPDTAEEVEAMVNCFYDPSRLYHEDVVPVSPFWRAAMHMATKYMISVIRDRIVENLEKQWPSTLQAWVALKANKRCLEEEWEPEELDAYYDDVVPEPASAIRFARDFGVPSILPAAFYALSLIDPRDDWDTCRGPGPYDADTLRQGGRSARWHLLGPSDYRGLLIGIPGLWNQFMDFATWAERDKYSIYGRFKHCPCVYTTSKMTHSDVRRHGVLLCLGEVSVLAPDAILKDMYHEDVCETCRERISKTATERMEEIWSKLGAMFMLDRAS
ncbi:hypothetical protein OE88DRAFT_453896 [Heliocybe sulcata]|uniref:BTB domain-containing protein n=1 Tax=Heliocybe sulcata TaxID=5364 RepID=A0A5C3MV92_9AGAM|nr:hypothetical protein OE88DRAFT_453896 [Heliocybe sulcata]